MGGWCIGSQGNKASYVADAQTLARQLVAWTTQVLLLVPLFKQNRSHLNPCTNLSITLRAIHMRRALNFTGGACLWFVGA